MKKRRVLINGISKTSRHYVYSESHNEHGTEYLFQSNSAKCYYVEDIKLIEKLSPYEVLALGKSIVEDKKVPIFKGVIVGDSLKVGEIFELPDTGVYVKIRQVVRTAEGIEVYNTNHTVEHGMNHEKELLVKAIEKHHARFKHIPWYRRLR